MAKTKRRSSRGARTSRKHSSRGGRSSRGARSSRKHSTRGGRSMTKHGRRHSGGSVCGCAGGARKVVRGGTPHAKDRFVPVNSNAVHRETMRQLASSPDWSLFNRK